MKFKNLLLSAVLCIGFSAVANEIKTEEVTAGIFSRLASGVKGLVWDTPKDLVTGHPYITAFVVLGLAAAVTYAVNSEESPYESM